MLFNQYENALKYGAKILSSEVIGGCGNAFANYWYVNADKGDNTAAGNTPSSAFQTIQQAVTVAAAQNLIDNRGNVILVESRYMAALATDPNSYTENIIVPAAGGSNISIVGVSNNRTQGGLPQLKTGSATTTPLISVRAPGFSIFNMGINGNGGTGGGILLDDDNSTKTVIGVTIANCHLKNCVGSTATDCRTGGAIMWSANGGAWQVRIANNVFYKNVGDVVVKGTAQTQPQDVIIENNTFQGIASAVDCHLYLAGGSGILGVTVNGNTFADVLPALSSGSIVRYADLTGCTGIFSNNSFAGSYTTSGFGAAKAAAKIPTTVGIVHNYSDAGLIVREA